MSKEVRKSIIPYESEDPFSDVDIPDFDLGQIMDTIEKENSISTTQMCSVQEGSTTTNMIQQRQFYHRKKNPQIPIFNNCKIGNINITINKN